MKKNTWYYLVLELVVVFIGITAGFVLQNNKENSQNAALEQKYINGFIEDVNVNIQNLEESIGDDSLWLASTKYAVEQIISNTLSHDSVCSLMMRMTMFSEFSEQSDTYEDIINSGNLNLLKDYELKKEIVKYHKSLKDYKILDFKVVL